MDPVRRTARQHNLVSAMIGVVCWGTPVWVLLPSQALRAQASPATIHIIDGAGAGDFDTRTVRRGFDLFGSGDAAFSGMRATGHYGTAFSNYGDCDGTLRNCQYNRLLGTPGGFYPAFFEVEWVAGTPPTELAKIRAVASSAGNATGGGWTAGYNRTVLGQPKRFGPHDGTLGRMFSGVTSTEDGSCRDHSGDANGNYGPGFQLLPTSDCPATWGTEGWQGAHPVDAAGWKAEFDELGAAFAWEFWRVAPQHQRLDRPFLSTHHHTYGETSDYNTEVLANYGAVVPGGFGAPKFEGYPLGLLIHFDVFNFALPSVNGAYFVQATVVNRSQDLWGAPIDYDSLYFGLSLAPPGGAYSRYADPARGLVVIHSNNVQGAGGPCDDVWRQPYSGWVCYGAEFAGRGYDRGVTAQIFLKTPLGDLRNKLFTRTADGAPCTSGKDPFCMPEHPLAGDTLTFNRQAFGDYGGADAATWATGARASFGYLSATETNTLAGRAITDFNERTQYSTFRSEFWPTNKAHHNKYVPPGGWDYNHDGILDTLALDTCGQYGCAVIDSDTMPGGWLNRRGNMGGLHSFGPFTLRAGDTTSFVYAMVGGSDSVQFWGQVEAVIGLYLDFYRAPDAPPPVRITAAQTTPRTAAGSGAQVRLYFGTEVSRWEDPYLLKLADDVDAAAPGSTLGVLASLNPTLANDLRARAADNIAQVEIYKSCDGGATFTADATCQPARAADVTGTALGTGWRAYAAYGGNDPLPAFVDDAVQDGRAYLYSVVARTRGAEFPLLTPDGPAEVAFAPPLRHSLSVATTDPSVVSVYVPVSKPAGFRPATYAITARGTATAPVAIELTDSVRTASYRAIFGHEILVARDSSVSRADVQQSRVTVQRRQFVYTETTPYPDSVIKRETFTYPSALPFVMEGNPSALDTTVSGDIATVTIRYGVSNGGLVLLLARADGRPIFGSVVVVANVFGVPFGGTMPPELRDRDDYPGFQFRIDQSLAGQDDPDREAQLRGALSLQEAGLSAADSVVPRPRVDQTMVQWLGTYARRPNTRDGIGTYEITWQDDPFGLVNPLALDITQPAAMEAAMQGAISARIPASVALNDAETATLVGVAQTELVPTPLPFTIRNVTFDRPVDVAMRRRASDQFLLGAGTDTVSVAVPTDVWLPGDPLYFIENIVEDSVYGSGLVLGPDGLPLQRIRRAMTFSAAALGCAFVRATCNPVRAGPLGTAAYAPMRAGDRTRFGYFAGFTTSSEIRFDVTAPLTGAAISEVTDSALAEIRVVPNPFVVYSLYQASPDAPRIMFTHVPPRGMLRIYTVAGQLVQQITWEPADLLGDGDLHWDLQTRDGGVAGGGLYIWVLTAPSDPQNASSRPLTARGKLVIVR